jgi:hypothetical protein
MKYVILDADEVGDIVFSEVLETSETVLKYEGAKPRFLYGKDTYTHSEILAILATSAWTPPFVPPDED